MRMDDLLNVLIYVLIPLLTVIILFFVKRKLLWLAPLVSTSLVFITYIMAFKVSGIEILYLFGYSESRAFFLLAMLIQLVIVIMLTAIACFIAYILKRKKK